MKALLAASLCLILVAACSPQTPSSIQEPKRRVDEARQIEATLERAAREREAAIKEQTPP